MKQLQLLAAAVAGFFINLLMGPPCARQRFADVAFTYRMGAGIPGDVDRAHPFEVQAALLDASNPAPSYGYAMLFGSANNVRAVVAADQAAGAKPIAGILVRPYPTQQSSGGSSASIGSATPPQSGIVDYMPAGIITVKGKAGMTVKKGDPCYIWAIATAGANIQGEFQAAATASSTVLCSNARYFGPADANGNVQIEVWKSNS